MSTIVATKILDKASHSKLVAANLNLVEHAFIEIKFIPFYFNGDSQCVVFSSSNAVKSFLKRSIDLPLQSKCYCVGEKTKKLLEQNGFKKIAYANNADELVKLLKKEGSCKEITYFCGNIRKNTLPNFFKNWGAKYNEIVVYETQLAPFEIINKPNAILFFSPSGVASYLMKNKITDEICFCIGNTTAAALKTQNTKIRVAYIPAIEMMIEDVLAEYKK